MIRQLKALTVRMVAGGSTVTALILVAVGYVDHVNPAAHPVVACAGLAFPVFLLANMGFLAFWLVFKLRYALIPLAGYAAVFPALRVYIPVNAAEAPPPGAIKVLSYNVQGYSGAPRYDDASDMIVDYFKDSGADIICTQEDLTTNHSIKARMDSLYAHSDTVKFRTGNYSNAIGIYTRFPIVRKERIAYPSRANGSVAYYLLVGRDTVLVVNNHFESNHLSVSDREKYKEILKGDVEGDTAKAQSRLLLDKLAHAAALRAPQADAVARYLDRHRQYPTILCGDFNDIPLSYTRRTLAERLTDCFVETGRGPGISYNQKGFYVRIDNIMCSARFKPYNCKVDSKIDASDHYPIFCWLKMVSKPTKNTEKQL